MGSLTSRPKTASVAATPQVVYVPTPAASDSGTSPSSPSSSTTDPVAVAEQRAESVLRRSRSRLGTVLTGLGGLLAPNGLSIQRKSLLGE